MKKLPLFIALGLLAACDRTPPPQPPPKLATAEEIMEKSGCLSCHQKGNQMQLPTWDEIASRYKENRDSEAVLVDKIGKGGSGSWGKMGMPPYHPELSEEERKAVIHKILSTPAQ